MPNPNLFRRMMMYNIYDNNNDDNMMYNSISHWSHFCCYTGTTRSRSQWLFEEFLHVGLMAIASYNLGKSSIKFQWNAW